MNLTVTVGKDIDSIVVRIHAIPPPDFLKPSRFHPQKNNIRTDWFTGQNAEQGKFFLGGKESAFCVLLLEAFNCLFLSEITEPPTPQYNSTVVGDHLPRSHQQFLRAHCDQCPAFRDGVALLKVWLRQRELDKVYKV